METRKVIPLMILSDSPAGSSGLGRITRDLALRIHASLSDVFRVGTFGVGGQIASSSRLPFFNCSIIRLQNMIPGELNLWWEDFAGRYGDGIQEDTPEYLAQRSGQLRKGCCLCVMNLSWVQWLSQPYLLPPEHPVRNFLLPRPASVSEAHWQSISSPTSPSFAPALLTRLADQPFQRWLYCPVDGNLPDGTLGHQLAPVLQGFDRVLGYTRFASETIERTLEKWAGQSPITTTNSVPHLPHGLDRATFYPRLRAEARQSFFPRVSQGLSHLPLKDDQILLAMSGTNSSRKCWQTFFETGAELLRRGVNVFLWGHTDCLQPHPASPAVCWNLPALAKQTGLIDLGGRGRVCLTTARLSDDDLAWAYSAADVAIAVSSEGWGFFNSEALACGLPIVGTSYAGSAEFTPPAMRVDPMAYASEQPFLINRPIYSASAVADRVQAILSLGYSHTKSLLDAQYEWDQCWDDWKDWLRKGVE